MTTEEDIANGVPPEPCDACGGAGWYPEPDKNGNETQIQCPFCLGYGVSP